MNIFIELELAFKQHTRTVTDPDYFREFLRSQKEFATLYFHKIDPGKTHIRLIYELVRKPELLKVFLEEGYGIHSFRPILMEVLRSDRLESLQVLFEYPPYHSRLKQRSSLATFQQTYTYFNEDFADLLTYSGPRIVYFLLEHPWMKENLTGSRLMFLSTRLTEDRLRQIFNHPLWTHLLYDVPLPYDWIKQYNTYVVRNFRTEYIYGPFTPDMYDNVQLIYMDERRKRIQQRWRFLFWCVLLRSRIREFVERYWAPGGPKASALQKEFALHALDYKKLKSEIATA